MADDPPISDDDAAAFRAAVADVQRLRDDRRVRTLRKPPAPRPRFTEADEREVIDELGTARPDPDIETGDELSWRRDGVQHTVMRRLRRGHYHVERQLDLHGLRVEEARRYVAAFLTDAVAQGFGCVRIVHGKGLGSKQRVPVLKQHVSGWLMHSDKVLAFASARPEDGGTGAVVVLLRRQRAG